MRLSLREIIERPGRSVSFECELSTEYLDFPAVAAYKSAPKASGRVYNEAGVLNLEGVITADMICICDRCANEYESTKRVPLNATIVRENPEDDPDYYLLEGDEIDLDEILTTAFILSMDTKFLCREDCKGLCPVCGKNLNLGACSCRKQKDPRFAVLEQLLDKDSGE